MRRILLLCLSTVLILSSYGAYAQERTVSGRVTSAEDGTALPGVNVILKGTTSGTVTDASGRYSLEVPATGGSLMFTFIGLASQEAEIGSRSVIDVQMASDIQQLTEVVVTAFGIERQANEITYATQSVKSKDLLVAQQTTAAQGLVGKVAGLQINVQNNGVNPTSQVVLRGFRSISKDNGALIVIDGVISTQTAFDNLNPNDIANIEVLKGANAAALYGARAANGALIVTTKGGTNNQQFTIGLQSTYTLQRVSFMPDFQTSYGIGWAGEYLGFENTNWGPRFDGVSRQVGPTFADGTFQSVPYAPIKDNLKDFYETGKTFQNTIYASGGTDKSKYYFSIGNQRTSGIVPDDEYKRTTVTINASQKLGKLELGVNSNFFSDDRNIVGNAIGDQERPLYWFVLNTPANIPLTNYKDWRNPEGFGYADNYFNAFYQNPYWAIGTNRELDKSTRLVANFSVNYSIADNIKWISRAGVNSRQQRGKNWRDRQEYDPILQPYHTAVSSFLEDTEAQQTNYNGSSIVQGNFKVANDFSVAAILGTAFIQEKFTNSYIRGNNLSIPNFYHISNKTGEPVVDGYEEQRREVGFFGDVTLGYRDFVFLQLTGRQDYTSTLPRGKNSYFYPSVGLSFVASEAIEAIKNSNVISFAKFSISNATVYNDLAPYEINERFSQPDPTLQFPFPLGSTNGFALNTVTVDNNIEKEKLNTTEVTAQLGFLNGRVNLDASYYVTKTTNLITQTTPSFASGANAFLTNIGELEAKGIELSLGGTVVKVGGFDWRLNLNYTSNETVIKEIKDDIKEVSINTYGGGTYGVFAVVGQAFPQIKAQSYKRDPQGRVIVGNDGNPLVGEVISLGKTIPDYIIGATSTMSFKGFSLATTIDYRTGHVYYEQGSDQMEFTGRSIASVQSDRQPFVWPNSVLQVGETFVPNNDIQITGADMNFWIGRYNEIKENYVKDATAFKIREVALNYEFPKSMLVKTKAIKKLTLGFVARNLLVWLPKENRFSDPEFMNTSLEVSGARSNATGIGGFFQSPPTRSYGINLNIEF